MRTTRVFPRLLVGLGILCLSLAGAEAKPPRNVLFIAADDLRTDLHGYGDPVARTPNFDRLAARGMQFNRAYCQQALCNPSRTSLLTGRRPDTLKIWDLPTHFRQTDSRDVVTLPQHFKQHGYFTQGIGKIYHNFHQTIEGDPASWSTPAVMHFTNHASDVALLDRGEPTPPNLARALKTECRDVPDEAYFDGRIAALAMQALRQRAAALATSAEPFFLAVGFWKPHLPFNPPKKYWDLYRREEIPLPANPGWPVDTPRIAWHNSRELLGEKPRNLTDAEVRELRHGYYAGISYLDAQVGRVIDELDRLRLADNTVIVFWSDHGFHLGEHSLWCKTSNFDLDAHVPLLIATPGGRNAGAQTEALAELIDLYPTLIELCGLPGVDGLDGRSLVPVLHDPRAAVKSAAYTQHPRPAYYKGAPEAMGYSVRTDRHRYTEWRDWKTGAIVGSELYDHAADPRETRNVAKAWPAIVAEHHRLLPPPGGR